MMTSRWFGIHLFLLFVSSAGTGAGAQTVGSVALDLAELAGTGALRPGARELSEILEGGYRGVRVEAGLRHDVAWIDEITFATGTIELDLRGRDLRSRSFLGVAFGAVNDSTYETVFLRPFNFRAADPLRRAHSIQYQSMPTHPWSSLRAEFPEAYEGPTDPSPDPDDWVRLRLVIEVDRVSIFVGEGVTPDLIVNRINASPDGAVGLWVGNFSGGDFTNLRLSAER